MLAVWRAGGSVSIPLPAGKKAIGIEGETLDIAPGQPVTIDETTVYLVDVTVAAAAWRHPPLQRSASPA